MVTWLLSRTNHLVLLRLFALYHREVEPSAAISRYFSILADFKVYSFIIIWRIYWIRPMRLRSSKRNPRGHLIVITGTVSFVCFWNLNLVKIIFSIGLHVLCIAHVIKDLRFGDHHIMQTTTMEIKANSSDHLIVITSTAWSYCHVYLLSRGSKLFIHDATQLFLSMNKNVALTLYV